MQILGRQIKAGVSKRCDFCHRVIAHNKVSYQVREGNAQGVYHGPRCYRAALDKYNELKKLTEK